MGETVGQGRASDININSQNLAITNNSILSSSASFATPRSQGNAGSLNITATANTILENDSSISSSVDTDVIGNGGQVNLTTNSLQVRNNSRLSTSSAGTGNAGQLTLTIGSDAVFDNNSSVASEVLQDGRGNGGQVNLTAGSLQLSNTSKVSTNTFGRGNAGQLIISVRDRAIVDNNSLIGSSVTQTGIGNGGQANLTAGSLRVANNSVVTTSTLGRGNAGNLEMTIRGTTEIADDSFIASEVTATAIGNGGQINLATGSLRLSNNSRISTNTLGRGQAGSLNINVSENAAFDNSFAGSEVGKNAVGDGGQVNVQTGSLTLTNGGAVSASTSGRGNSGSLNINVRNAAIFDGSSSGGRSSGIETGVAATAIGDGGALVLNAGSLTVTNGAAISAETQGQGNAGNATVNVRADAIFDGSNSGVFSSASADALGDGGQVTVNSGTLTLRNGAVLNSSAAGQGVAGDITVNAGFVSLDRSRILTETRSGDGGNSALNVDGILVLRYGSLISTTAGTSGAGGNGGNIDIFAEFVVGVPGENSDITANAFEGQGGSITITTNGIYGLSFRSELTPLSDITASSKFGLNGTFTLDLLSFPAERGVNELPGALVDAEALVGRDVCAVQNRQIAGGSSFLVVGRGGLPPNPTELMTPMEGTVAWATRAQTPATVSVRARNEPLANQAIQQMQGWVVAPDGTVMLTEVVPTVAMGSQGYAYPTCGRWTEKRSPLRTGTKR